MSDVITGTVYVREQVGAPNHLLKGRTMYMLMGVIAAPKGIFPNETQLPSGPRLTLIQQLRLFKCFRSCRFSSPRVCVWLGKRDDDAS